MKRNVALTLTIVLLAAFATGCHKPIKTVKTRHNITMPCRSITFVEAGHLWDTRSGNFELWNRRAIEVPRDFEGVKNFDLLWVDDCDFLSEAEKKEYRPYAWFNITYKSGRTTKGFLKLETHRADYFEVDTGEGVEKIPLTEMDCAWLR